MILPHLTYPKTNGEARIGNDYVSLLKDMFGKVGFF